MTDRPRIVWVVGATRSCKTAFAKNGIAPLGYELVSTGNYFRNKYAKPDTYDRSFVFGISDYASTLLSGTPDAHEKFLERAIETSHKPLVIEGERNPVEFSRLYNPHKDMVFFLNRLDVEKYDTAIERGINGIEHIIRWCVSNGISPKESVVKMTFGLGNVTISEFGKNNGLDHVLLSGKTRERDLNGNDDQKYPWMNVLIGFSRERIVQFYGAIPDKVIAAGYNPHPI